MKREYYLDLAEKGLRMPIAAHLLLARTPDPERCRMDGQCLGKVLIQTAHRFRTPLAFPLMDLRIEKEWLLQGLGVPEGEIDTFHFDPDEPGISEEQLERILAGPLSRRMQASAEALSHVQKDWDSVPVGMSIGPFSLFTKLLEDPIPAAFDIINDPESEEAANGLFLLHVATEVIGRWLEIQMDHGAKAICICEPAYNTVYISPSQIDARPEILETLALQWNKKLKAVLEARGVDLIFHDCGELNAPIIRSIGQLDPAILSLGSTCDLAEVAPLVDNRTVLFGNLPSKRFVARDYTEDDVRREGAALRARMKEVGHPFILGSECDVLSVAGSEDKLLRMASAVVE